ncbi:MAG: hypothetical protein U5Q44_02365, partial [Dehalococcoidia bacterium]|nr:hypothetical protein [Dehalococcoidia bacterium]
VFNVFLEFLSLRGWRNPVSCRRGSSKSLRTRRSRQQRFRPDQFDIEPDRQSNTLKDVEGVVEAARWIPGIMAVVARRHRDAH